jgi:predicted flap endonuclease-1-like 5' DNA nuclease
VPYTLSMGLLWFAAAFVVGLVTGILLRSVVARRQIAAARAAGPLPSEPPPPSPAPEGSPPPPERADLASDDRPVTNVPTPSPAVLPAEEVMVPAAEEVLGHSIARDDLTVVEGLGPHVAELCRGIGIVTWRELADTEVSLLRTMLDDAGGRYQVHDPTTWPAQARLLADGRWAEFRDTVAAIRSGAGGST